VTDAELDIRTPSALHREVFNVVREYSLIGDTTFGTLTMSSSPTRNMIYKSQSGHEHIHKSKFDTHTVFFYNFEAGVDLNDVEAIAFYLGSYVGSKEIHLHFSVLT
jgi:hypothetical protein